MASERGYLFRRSKAVVLNELAGRHEKQVKEWSRPPGGGLSVAVFVTPGGGIAARSGATLGSATCTRYTVTGGTRASTTETQTVYNHATSAIAGSTDIIAFRINGIWVAIFEDC